MNEPNAPKKRGCLFYGCIFALIGSVCFVGVIAGVFYYGKSLLGNVTPVADNFLQHIDKNEYPEAYAMLGAGWKKDSLEKFTQFEKGMQAALGTLKSKTQTGMSFNTDTSGTTALLSYSAEFTKGPATLNFTLIKEGDVWKVNGLEYKSKLLEAPADATEKPETPEAPPKPDN